MADPSDPFQGLGPADLGPTRPPLPAAEVRAAGDRMRRRRTAWRAVAAAAAVAVVTTGGVALGGGLPSTAPAPMPATEGPQPTTSAAPTRQPSPSPTPLTEIPADFPIAANIAVTHDPPAAALAERLEFCGDRPLAYVSPVDAVSAESSGGETSETRTLLLFGDAGAAADAETALLAGAAACPEEVTNVVGEIAVLPASGDWPGRTVRTTYGSSSAKFVHAVRSGPALLLTQSYLQLPPEEGLPQSRAGVQPLVEAMGQFGSVTAPTGGNELPTEPVRVDIPAGFPLDLGYPEARFEETTRVGPEKGYQPIDHVATCGRVGFPTEEWADLLGASFEQPEDIRHRMLTTYPDVETARTVTARLVDSYRACPRETDDLGWARVTELREVEPGEEGYVAVQTSELEGAPAPGMGLTYVVRVGNAVLLHTTSNEGGGGEKQVREQTRLVTELAREMCVFSAGPCG